MENIQEILKNKHFVKSDKPVRMNTIWERATEFLSYIGIEPNKGNIVFTLKLCKVYGAGKVFALRSWMKDMAYDEKRWKGLVVWRLQQPKV